MPSKPKQTTKELLAENPELQLPKVVLQIVGIIFLSMVAAKFLLDPELSKMEGIVMLVMATVGTLLVIPAVAMSVLKMIKDKIPTIGGK